MDNKDNNLEKVEASINFFTEIMNMTFLFSKEEIYGMVDKYFGETEGEKAGNPYSIRVSDDSYCENCIGSIEDYCEYCNR